ncbi:Hypothetical predicted protein [Podarcis lilfordi]|uniref:Uncharacterized protein n=1 Tax=Podarcis lilfordi TaxID=74358 RepID=A0AA35K073_9SAUR|nr:Hypothetical predicted protein [Podarcis lilfordi]
MEALVVSSQEMEALVVYSQEGEGEQPHPLRQRQRRHQQPQRRPPPPPRLRPPPQPQLRPPPPPQLRQLPLLKPPPQLRPPPAPPPMVRMIPITYNRFRSCIACTLGPFPDCSGLYWCRHGDRWNRFNSLLLSENEKISTTEHMWVRRKLCSTCYAVREILRSHAMEMVYSDGNVPSNRPAQLLLLELTYTQDILLPTLRRAQIINILE